MAQVTVSRPVSRIVYQRNTSNTATVPVSGQADPSITVINARLVSRQGGNQVSSTSLTVSNGRFSGALTNVPGGWYDLLLETSNGTFRVERVGVGEVFIVAGHSVAQADNTYSIPYSNDDRVNAVPLPSDNPPYQPIPDPAQLPNTFGQYGNIRPAPFGVQPFFWSRFGEVLAQRFNVPILIFQTAYQGTTLEMWWKSSQGIYFEHYFVDASIGMPYANLKNTLTKYIPQTGVRAVLVDHGQNDYPFTNVQELVNWYNGFLEKARQDLGFPLKAVINRHTPFLYSNPQHHIRQVQEQVAQSANNFPGPDYDTGLTPSDRYDEIHLNSSGQEKAAQLWANVMTDAFWATATPYQPSFSVDDNQPPVAGGSGTGLQGNYFNNTSLSDAAVLSRIDATINFIWGMDSPQPGVVNADEFSVRWTGQVEAPVTGTYSFRTNNDDGTRVWVNNQLLIDNWTPQGPTPREGSINLTAGQKYDIKVEYFEAYGGAQALLYWVVPGSGSAIVVPRERLYPSASTEGGNQPPTVANGIPNQQASVGTAFSYSIPANTFSDPNGDALTYQITGLPAGLSANGLNISGTPTAEGTATVTVRASDPAGQAATTTFSLAVSAAPVAGGGTGTGLQGNYFNNTSLSGTTVLNRVDATINFLWGTDSPQPGVVNADEFSVRWTGQVEAPATGTYSFRTNNDDGTRVWVNNQLIIDNWTPQGPTPREGSINLTAGQKYDIKVEYFEAYGGAQALLYWVVPGSGSAAIVPRERLYPSASTGGGNQPPVVASSIPNQQATVGTAFSYSIPANTFSDPNGDALSYQITGLPAGLSANGLSISGTPTAEGTATVTVRASDPAGQVATTTFSLAVSAAPVAGGGNGTGLQGNYFNNMNLSGTAVLSRVDATINFPWGNDSPQPGVVNADEFSVRWTGQVEAPVTGTYSFRTNNDDGTRVWVNNQLLIDNWAQQGPTPKEGSISLTAGQKYDIKVEYFEAYGGAQALLYWVMPGSGSAVIVPRERLYPSASTGGGNQPPVVASSIPNQQATVGTAFSYSIPANTFSDPNGDALSYQITGLPAGLSANGLSISGTPTAEGTATVTVRASDPAGQAATTTFSLAVSSAPVAGGGSGTGLQGNYFNNMDLSGAAVLSRVDATINFPWGMDSPQPGVVNADEFSVRWTGQVEAPVTGTYSFRTNNDDGTRVWVNNQLLIDNWAQQGPTPREGSINLTAGQKYDIKVEYFEAYGGAQAQLFWVIPSGGSAVIVPKERLYPNATDGGNNQPPVAGGGNGTGLQGNYFNNMNLSGAAVLSRVDATINFPWGNDSPQPGVVNADEFSVRWTGQVEAPVTGTYSFRTNNDDGTRVWVNNQLIIDNWAQQGPTPREGSISLTAGQKYNIRVEYFEAYGGAQAQLFWVIPGSSSAVIVPRERLYPSTPSTRAGVSSAESISWSVYPNPATDVVTIAVPAGADLSRLSVEFITPSGRRIPAERIEAEMGTIRLPVHHLVPGLYILTVSSDGRILSTSKLLKR
ncbi:hypothetical protein GCM10023189_21730 [Nibrella saemangeumensis]|uniref:PA14 domain-containing protein n=1 Tax=Nibrella saemangeumensis TaxID=1084526 RepID=A0ABP8MTN5_9BACT